MTKKEAIEVIKTTMPYMWKETKEAIQTLIPEFAESDDEKIRKEIIDFLTDGIWNTIIIDNVRQSQRYAKWIAYLEKQREQKPVERLDAERDDWYVCIKDYYRGGKKQCSVGDLVQAKGGMYMMGEEDISEWFRRAYYEEVRDAFEPNTDMNITEQPAEWSEDDKEIINEVASILINDENRADNKVEEDRLAYLAEKIQSLCPQPHWKPSKEQMKALEEAMDRNDKIGYILRTLYDDIKKNVK